MSIFNSQIGKWQQTWVDNQGSYLDLIGEFKDGVMELRTTRMVENHPSVFRMTFYNIAKDEFDWNWERSREDGESWELLWKIHYRRKIPAMLIDSIATLHLFTPREEVIAR